MGWSLGDLRGVPKVWSIFNKKKNINLTGTWRRSRDNLGDAQ